MFLWGPWGCLEHPLEPLNNFKISVNSAGGGAGGDAGGGGFRILPKDFFSSGISGDLRNFFALCFEWLEQTKALLPQGCCRSDVPKALYLQRFGTYRTQTKLFLYGLELLEPSELHTHNVL